MRDICRISRAVDLRALTSRSDYGETWTPYSPMQARCCAARLRFVPCFSLWLQLGGFLLLITGVFAYNRVFKVPGFRYT